MNIIFVIFVIFVILAVALLAACSERKELLPFSIAALILAVASFILGCDTFNGDPAQQQIPAEIRLEKSYLAAIYEKEGKIQVLNEPSGTHLYTIAELDISRVCVVEDIGTNHFGLAITNNPYLTVTKKKD